MTVQKKICLESIFVRHYSIDLLCRYYHLNVYYSYECIQLAAYIKLRVDRTGDFLASIYG